MSIVSTQKCDGCGKLRVNDMNHWFEGATDGVEVRIAPMGELSPGYDARSNRAVSDHLCGQVCAMKWLSGKVGELRSKNVNSDSGTNYADSR